MTEPKFDTYLCQYEYDGKEWGFEIQAPSFEDAEARMRSIATSGKVDGKLVGVVPDAVVVKYEERPFHGLPAVYVSRSDNDVISVYKPGDFGYESAKAAARRQKN